MRAKRSQEVKALEGTVSKLQDRNKQLERQNKEYAQSLQQLRQDMLSLKNQMQQQQQPQDSRGASVAGGGGGGASSCGGGMGLGGQSLPQHQQQQQQSSSEMLQVRVLCTGVCMRLPALFPCPLVIAADECARLVFHISAAGVVRHKVQQALLQAPWLVACSHISKCSQVEWWF